MKSTPRPYLKVWAAHTFLLAALLGVLMLTDGYGGHASGRCHGLSGIAWVCNAKASVAPATRAQKYGDLFKLTYNAEAKASRWPHRVTLITCKPNGEAVFDCKVKLKFLTTGQVQCGVLVIDTGFNVWANHKVACPKLFPRVPA